MARLKRLRSKLKALASKVKERCSTNRAPRRVLTSPPTSGLFAEVMTKIDSLPIGPEDKSELESMVHRLQLEKLQPFFYIKE